MQKRLLSQLLPPSVLALVSALLHLIPFILFGPHPLGYDTGFYRRYLTEPLTSFPNAPVPGLGDDAVVPRILFDLLRMLHISPDIILYGSYIVLFSLIPILLFFFLKKHLGIRGAFFGGLLLILSPVFYNAYWFIFWKNALGISLLLFAFICLDRKWAKRAFVLDVVIALSHKTTAIIYIVSLAVFAIVDKTRWKESLLHIALVGGILFLVGYSTVHSALVASPVAIFMSLPTYLGLSIPFFIIIVIGYKGLRPDKLAPIAIAFSVGSFLFPILQIPFYERIFVFSDVAVVILAAYALEHIFASINLNSLSRAAYISIFGLFIAGGFLVGSLVTQIRDLRPLMTASRLAHIQLIGKVVGSDGTLLVTSDEAPWYEGWTLAHIAAPGMLRDNHNFNEWLSFWTSTSTDEKISFLNDFSQPLYISTLGSYEDILGSTTVPCLREVAPQLLLDSCGTP